MILSAHQLHYLPWLRYLQKIARSDIFVVLDNLQFNKGGFQNRTRIKTRDGSLFLTVPVFHKYQQELRQVRIDSHQEWGKKHLHALLTHYGKAPCFSRYREFFSRLYGRSWEYLNGLNREILSYLLDALQVKTRVVYLSELLRDERTAFKVATSDLPMEQDNLAGAGSQGTERLVTICKALGAETYLSGDYAGETYLEREKFEKEGIRLQFQNWSCPAYTQLFPEAGFLPDLSIIDLLFNEGPLSLSILLGDKVPHA